MERKPETGSKQSPYASLTLGEWVTVSMVYRPKGSEAGWQPLEEYRAWEGQVVSLPSPARMNGNVNIMPHIPRAVSEFPEYENIHPKVCDVSPREAELTDGTVVQFRHAISPLENGPTPVPSDAE